MLKMITLLISDGLPPELKISRGFVLRTVTALVARQRHWQRPMGLVLMVHPISFASAGYVLESKQTFWKICLIKKTKKNVQTKTEK